LVTELFFVINPKEQWKNSSGFFCRETQGDADFRVGQQKKSHFSTLEWLWSQTHCEKWYDQEVM